MNKSSAILSLQNAVRALPETKAELHMEQLLPTAIAALPDFLDTAEPIALFVGYEQPYVMCLSYAINGGKFSNGRPKKLHVACHYFFGENYDDIYLPNTNIQNPYYGKEAHQGNNLFHPHGWATAFHILQGRYYQNVGLAAQSGLEHPPERTHHILQDSDNPETNHYAFNNSLLWHEVLPADNKPVSTIMVSYTPTDWDQTRPVIENMNDNRRLYPH
ncbi:MAG TPA: hypothetical protein VGF14_07695 [Alphaproteobacteria bacterium]